MLKHAALVTQAVAALVFVATVWLGFRSEWPELYALALIAGAGAYLATKVAIEVVSLVAETLMPR